MERPDIELDQTVADALSEANTDLCQVTASEPARLLVVGGDVAFRNAYVAVLVLRQHHCSCVESEVDARAALARHRYDVILLNSTLADHQGLELVALAQKTSPATKFIVFSQAGSVHNAVQAMRCGAIDFISLPVAGDEFASRVDHALIKSRVERQRDERFARLKKVCRERLPARNDLSAAGSSRPCHLPADG
jgi:DNA-binding NtrC family response regulator